MKTKKNKIKYNKNNKKTQKGGNISININEHIDKSFKELNIILDKTQLNVRFPNLEAFKKDNKLLFRQLTNKNELTNLGKGLAITQWPQNNFLQLIPFACSFLSNKHYVILTYAAITIFKVLQMKKGLYIFLFPFI